MKLVEQIIFPPFRLDLVNEQLWRENQLVPLRPKTFAVLRFLVEHAGRLLTKEELLKGVWPDTRVNEGILKGYIRDLRDMLGDDAQHPRFIETVPRRGHRFIAAVTAAAPVPHSAFQMPSPPPSLPPRSQSPASLLVGRNAELAHLHTLFAKALRGERQIVFVTGEPGIGKTTLVEAFLDSLASSVQRPESEDQRLLRSFSSALDPRRQTLDGFCWLGRGQCVEQHGTGEAYLPVLEALGRIGRAVGGKPFVAMLQQYAPTWLVQMPALVGAAELETLQRRVLGATHERMLREMVEAIEALAAQRPLVLWLEDLHWADASTVDWLAAVAQRGAAARLMVVGTYRPSDLSLSNHPLRAVKQELVAKGLCEELWLPFLSADDVTQYLTKRYAQQRFPMGLGAMIHQRTDGNPLFVVNLVEYLAAQGVIAEVDGYWQLQTAVEEVERGVPDNLRQLIDKHLERLAEEHQRLLEVASVAGVIFTTTAVAAGVEAPVEQIEEWCDGLVKRGQFLQAQEPRILPDGALCGRYGFQHALQQVVVYERIPNLRRIRLHRRIGEGEERQYGEHVGLIAAELAAHFERGQEYDKAAQYHLLAGLGALRRQANREAIAHFTQGIALLSSLPETSKRLQQELQLQAALIAPIIMTAGYAAPALGRACARARELCQQGGDPHQLLFILWRLIGFYLTRAELQTARELGEQLLRLVHSAPAPALLPAVHLAVGQPLFHLGEFALARTHLEQSTILYDRRMYQSHAVDSIQDPGVTSLCYEAWDLWFLGYAEQALKLIQAAFSLAQELSHPHELAWALNYTAALHFFRREPQATQEQAEAAIRLSNERGFPFWAAMGTLLRGWALAMLGRAEEGIAQMHEGLATWKAMGAVVGQPGFLAMLAEAQGQAGQTKEGLLTLSEALTLVAKTGDRYYEVELYRLRGELMLAQSRVWSLASGAQDQEDSQKSKRKSQKSKTPNPKTQTLDPQQKAEACFLKAIAIARQQQAKSLELRAVMSLVRLRQQQASAFDSRTMHHASRVRLAEARTMLSNVYHWFTEGFDTKDLQDAQTVIEELSY